MGRMARQIPAGIQAWLLLAVLLGPINIIAAQLKPSEKPFVWQLLDLPVPFYLVGTMHSLTREDYPLAPVYHQVLARAERVVFEYDPRQRPLLARKFREISHYPDGHDLETELSPATFALLKKNTWRFATSVDALRKYRPWAIALRILNRQASLGPADVRSMDFYLTREAQRAGKELGGLETVDEHIAFWRDLLERDGENLLLYVLTRSSRTLPLIDRTRDAWRRGDAVALAATTARLRRSNPGIAGKLFYRRNAIWVPRIEAEMKSGKPTVIVAGAAHFIGTDSVVDLLRARGHKLRRL
jgi:uncharacterized protein YbaP (TraB family)